jgi:hypothetical protein
MAASSRRRRATATANKLQAEVTEMANLGKVSNELSNGGAAGGIGSECLSGPAVFIDDRGTFWLNQHEASARRGQARGANGQGKSGPNETQGR